MKSYSLIAAIIALLASTAGNSQWRTTDTNGKPIEYGANQASVGDFGALQLSTTDPEKLLAVWRETTPGVEIQTQHKAARGEVIHTFVVFTGCKTDAAGTCHVTAQFEVFDPAGKSYAVATDAPIYDSPPAPPHNLMLGQSSLGIRIEPGELLGNYRVVVHTTDRVANLAVTTQDSLTVYEAPLAGGWNSFIEPDKNKEALAAAHAALPNLPRPNAHLAKIERGERQVVTGINYRLILRLSDNSRWTVTIWHKLDGTWKARDIAGLR